MLEFTNSEMSIMYSILTREKINLGSKKIQADLMDDIELFETLDEQIFIIEVMKNKIFSQEI